MARPDGLDPHEVEELAQRLYEGADRVGVAWARRDLIIREMWCAVAAERLLAKGKELVA